MKDLKYNKKLIAYANSFVSFVFPNLVNVNEIILFGSVAREEATIKSDVDLFFNVDSNKVAKKLEKEIKILLDKFYKSKIAEIWSMKDITNNINIKVGNLDKWSLKRSIVSDGIVLYGRYKKTPEKLKGFVYFNLSPIKNITKRNRILRRLFGRKEKTYLTEGIIEKDGGKKLSALSFTVPLVQGQAIIKLLSSEKIDYTFFEFWSDQI